MTSWWRGLAGELSSTIVRVLAYLGALAVIFVLCTKLFDSPAVEAAVEPATRAQWLAIERPYRAFALTMPDFPDPEGSYVIKRHRTGAGRKDVMDWSAPAADDSTPRPLLRIEIYRPGQEIAQFDDPAAEAAALSAELGGPYPGKPGVALISKFGRAATFEFSFGEGERARTCLGFARSFRDPLLLISGWYCTVGPEIIDRSVPACALERLSLLMAASEPKVTSLFSRAELYRKPCLPRTKPGTRSATSGHEWLDGPRGPKLRGGLRDGS